MKLNLGCGDQILDNWINVDLHHIDPRVIRDDIISLTKIPSMKDRGTYELIYVAHALIYVPRKFEMTAFKRWAELLEKGGKLIVEEPYNIEKWERFKVIRPVNVIKNLMLICGLKNITELEVLPGWSRHVGGYAIEGTK